MKLFEKVLTAAPSRPRPQLYFLVMLSSDINCLHSVIEKVQAQTLTIVNAVKDAIHENDVQSGVVNLTTLEVSLIR